jgi:hypothetical protein
MESYVTHTAAGTQFVGEAAVQLYAAMSLRKCIDIYVKTGMQISRVHTPKAMAAAATKIMGKNYKSSKKALAKASAELEVWISNSKVPITTEV